MPTCPQPDRLNALLTNELEAAARDELAAHLRTCVACQRLVESIQATIRCEGPATIAVLPGVASVRDSGEPQETLASAPSGLPSNVTGKPQGFTGYLSLPDYEILAELGRGGMGVVYKARQISLDRLVALKVIRSAAIADDVQLARFNTEAAALAQLQHPNIVQIFAIGRHQDMPFLAMEFVAGATLAEALLEHRLEAKQSAHMVEKLARAMDSAHQRGILHRDLKPSNVLLGTDGEPKIMDFGLAKRVGGESHLTVDHTVMGTPSYMPPEQAQGKIAEVDQRSDIYALGAILYELLTARPPFRGATPLETIRQVIHLEVPIPRSFDPRVPIDLETICLKCLQKQPAQRFETAADLADDLRRFQRGEPIQARRVSAVVRGWLWCRRNPALATAIGAAILAAGIGAGGIAWQSSQAKFERSRGFQRFASESADKLRLIQDLMERVPEDQRAQDDRLQSAVSAVETWLREEPADESARASYADALFRVAEIRRRIGQFALAQEMYLKALACYQQLSEKAPAEIAHRRALAETRNWLGEAYRESGELHLAVEQYNDAMKQLDSLPSQPSSQLDLLANSARCLYNRALALRDLNRREDSEKDLRKSIELLLASQQQGSAPAAWRQGLARSRINLGILLWETNRPVAADQEYLDAIRLLEELEQQEPQSADFRAELATALMNRANLLLTEHTRQKLPELNLLEQSESLFQRSVKKLQALTGQYENVPRYRKELANSLNGLGAVWLQRQQLDEAERVWKEASAELSSLASRSPQIAEYHALLAQTHFNLALLYRQTSQSEPLARFLQRAVDGQRQAVSLSPRSANNLRALAGYERALSRVLVDAGNYSAAADAAFQSATHAGEDARMIYAAARMLAACAVAAERDAAGGPSHSAKNAATIRASIEPLLASCRQLGLTVNPDDFPGMNVAVETNQPKP